MEDLHKTTAICYLTVAIHQKILKICLWLANNKIGYLVKSSKKKKKKIQITQWYCPLMKINIHNIGKQTFDTGEFVCHKHFMITFNIIKVTCYFINTHFKKLAINESLVMFNLHYQISHLLHISVQRICLSQFLTWSTFQFTHQ